MIRKNINTLHTDVAASPVEHSVFPPLFITRNFRESDIQKNRAYTLIFMHTVYIVEFPSDLLQRKIYTR